MIDRQEQHHLEMLYLLVVRCKANISRARQQVKQKYSEEISTLFNRETTKLYDRIVHKFENVSE
jgi:hypothetical protein